MVQTSQEYGDTAVIDTENTHTFQADGTEKIELPSSTFIADATMTRQGNDLVLETPNGETAVIEGYFSASPTPLLVSADGGALTPNLVKAFAHSPMEFAANETATDESPVGAVEELKGNATVTRADGTVEKITIGTPIYQGDIIETDAKGAVNISFIDETTMAISENARLAIDKYTFDPSTESGTTNFSVLRGLFVFTSGLIGRDDPDDVQIDTPVGSIGIRGTIIAGDINPNGESKVTVLEGAIVVKNGLMEETLSSQFETVRLGGFDQPMESMGVVPAADISNRFNSIGTVSPSLFTTINDAVKEQSTHEPLQSQPSQPESVPEKPAGETSNMQQPSAADTTAVQSSPAPTPALVSVQDIMTLNGDSTGLPLQHSGPIVLSQAPSNAAPAPALSITTVALATSQAPPASNTPNTADHIQPPPQVIAGTTPSTAPALALHYTGGTITDIASVGTVIGAISTGVAGFSYSLSTTSPYYTLAANGTGVNIVLTSAGANYLGSSLDVLPLGGFTINATHTDGRTLSSSYGITVTDANAPTGFDLNGTAPNRTTIIADNLENNIGYTISALGDINNDGFDDFAFSNNVDGQNHTYTVYGQAAHLPSGNLANLGSQLAVVTHTTNSGSTANTVVAGIGDFNGDGIEDYIIGQSDNNTSYLAGAGYISIVSGTDAANNRTFAVPPGSLSAGSQFGYSVDGVGDYNNDGFADVIVGAPGSSYAYFLKGGDAAWNTALTTASNIQGGTGTAFGTSVQGIADFNGDGYSDFAVSDPQANGGQGYVKISYGNTSANTSTSTTMLVGSGTEGLGSEIHSLGDINGDGKSDILVSGNLNVAKIYYGGDVTADSKVDITNTYTVTGSGGIGDFNGDGYDDFAIGLADGDSTKSYIVFGRSELPANMDLDFFKNPENALEIQYNRATDADGLEYSALGDINGDGYDDFGVGLPDANGAAAGNGGVAIIYGHSVGHTGQVGTSGNDTLSNAGLTNASMRGGAGNDLFQISNTNFLGIDGGTNTVGGKDTIRAMANLDFRNLDFEKISGIEQLQYGATGQTMTLSVENIFNLLKSSDTGSLTIDSALSGNVLNLHGGTGAHDGTNANIVTALAGMSGGSVNEAAGSGYNEFSIGGYKLYIDADVTVNIQ